MKHASVFVAGTFEGLHAGHRLLLTRAFEEGERVTIGLTSDAFVRHHKLGKLAQLVQFNERKKALERWLAAQKLDARAAIISIDDPYEPAASMKDPDALVVTAENRKRGVEINKIRRKRSLAPLALIEVPIVAAQDGNPLSSTRVRNGEVDADGRLVMPESLRSLLGKPLGKVLTGVAIEQSIQRNRDTVIITVGDVATKTLLDAGVRPFLSIIDGKVGRMPFGETLKMLQLQKVKPFRFKSGPGYISREAMEAIEHCLSCHVSRVTCHAILIDGEEDLLVLPAILHAPPGAVLYYGQPPGRRARPEVWDDAGQAGEGLVEVWVSASMRKRARVLLKQFVG